MSTLLNICVVTGTRAEYGIFKPLLDKFSLASDINLQIIACCMHLSPEYGFTINEIINDGFKIDYRVEMLLSSDTNVGVTKSTGLGIISFADAYTHLKPDLIFFLVIDLNFCASSASLMNIPIAHCHGGELTEGCIDDALRHAITKMSHLHFTSTEIYRKRVIQLGESPDSVFNVGALGLDNLSKLRLIDKSSLEEFLSFRFQKLNFLVTYHPTTLLSSDIKDDAKNLLLALDQFENAGIVFTMPNADANGRIIRDLLLEYCQSRTNSICVTSLGQHRYFSMLQYVDLVIGNSSSGIIEVPYFKSLPLISGIGKRADFHLHL